jgi:hypothetical protein
VKDTVAITMRKNQPGSASIKLIPPSEVFAEKDTICFNTSSKITSINNDIRFRNSKDSVDISSLFDLFIKDVNCLCAIVPKSENEDVLALFPKNSVLLDFGVLPDVEIPFKVHDQNDFGNLEVDLSDYNIPLILIVKKGSKLIRRTVVAGPSKPIFVKNLLPGEYTFQVILDENGNGRWDPGEIETRTLPEGIHFFTTPIKVRSGWDSKIKLQPINRAE